jgi:hypothetical protein
MDATMDDHKGPDNKNNILDTIKEDVLLYLKVIHPLLEQEKAEYKHFLSVTSEAKPRPPGFPKIPGPIQLPKTAVTANPPAILPKKPPLESLVIVEPLSKRCKIDAAQPTINFPSNLFDCQFQLNDNDLLGNSDLL